MAASEKKTILVVDDEPEVRKLVGAMVSRQGFEVLAVLVLELLRLEVVRQLLDQLARHLDLGVLDPNVLLQLLDGTHSIERSEEVHLATLQATYAAMAAYNVSLEHLILKTSMVVSGKDNPRQAGVEEVAERTVRILRRTVPAAQPGIVFLSGGQSDEAATAHLNAMAAMPGLPWPLTFSYSRALQNPALNAWRGQAGNVAAAQKAFHHRAHMNSLASQGKWRAELERQAA